jgi:imidazole glycerol-phosphate synthase subunit HisF
MLKHRVIPCLLLQKGGLYKTTAFNQPKYVGDPINAIRIFNDKEVDELIVLDIEASKTGKGPDFDLIEQFAGECFMPLSYGGGIKTLEHASRLFEIGVEKVCIQTQALQNLNIVSDIAARCGNQSVIVCVDVKKNWLGRYQLYSSATQKTLDMPWKKFIEEAIGAGAGEIVINAVDKDGTMSGVDKTLIQQAAEITTAPLIAMGGVGCMDDFRIAVDAGASAVGAGAYFVFHGPHRAVLITYPRYQDLEELLK